MNATIIYKQSIKTSVLDGLSKELPGIISETMEVPGGNLARLKPEQISLAFSLSNSRDVGSEIRIIVFAKRNDFRTKTEDERAKAILDKVIELISTSGEKYSVDVRLYLMEIGVAEHSLST